MNITSPEPSTFLLEAITFLFYQLRAAVVGGVGIGLFLGAFYFLGYLVYISRLPTDSRVYRQQSHLLDPEKLLRYIILIACIITLNVLFFLYFQFGKKSSKAGLIIWACVGAFYLFKRIKASQKEKAKQ